jgi:Bacterial Ig domain
MMRRLLLAIGLMLFPLSAKADCASVRWNFMFGQETTTSRETDGAPCTFRMTDVGGDRAVYGVEIPVPPKHGSAASAGRATVVYRPQPGFKGEDSFVFELVGKMSGNPTSARVRVTVTVR